jgi:hypothetical protein
MEHSIMIIYIKDVSHADKDKMVGYKTPFCPKVVDPAGLTTSLCLWRRHYVVPQADIAAVDAGSVEAVERILASTPVPSGATTFAQANIIAGAYFITR